MVEPGDLAEYLVDHDITSLDIAPHNMLLLPLKDGRSSRSLKRIRKYANGLCDAGVDARVVEMVDPPVDSWVRTVAYNWVAPDDVINPHLPHHIIVPGLLGRVIEDRDRYGLPVAFTVPVRLVGRGDFSYYPSDLLEILDEEPTEEQIEEASGRYARAFEEYEAEHGWTGYFKLGKGRLRTEAQARDELDQLVGKLTDPARVMSEAERRGTWKRMRRIVAAFADHVKDSGAEALLDKMVATDFRAIPPELLQQVAELADRPRFEVVWNLPEG